MVTSLEKLELAERQLERIRLAWNPPDWANLSHYGFHALENAVDAAAIHLGLSMHRTHPARVDAATRLHFDHDFVDVSELLKDLNEVRKREAYGDIQGPELDPESTVTRIDEYVRSVRELIESERE